MLCSCGSGILFMLIVYCIMCTIEAVIKLNNIIYVCMYGNIAVKEDVDNLKAC